MMSRIFTTALAITIVLLPLGVQSSQPGVRVTDLAPQAETITVQPGFGLFLDVDAEADLHIEMPRTINEFDIDSDPFAVARV